MEEPHFIKCESVPESSPYLNAEELLPVSVEKIKVEPDLAFTDECTEEHSLGIVKEELDIQLVSKLADVCEEHALSFPKGNFVFVSALKEETNSELPAPGPSQKNTFGPSADIDGEISKEQRTTDELTPNTKQEDNGSIVAVSTVHPGKEAHAGTVWSKAFLHELNVKKHISAPSGEIQFCCKQCNSSFTRKSSLQNHMVVHSGERKFCCQECNKSFARKDNLQNHMVVHAGQKPYQCKECNSSFSYKGNLQMHMLLHSGVKPFQCKECNSSFAQKSNLRTHMVVHSRERRFCCRECNSSFTRKSSLRIHMFVHSGEKPFSCKDCDSSFADRSNLRSHMLTHSREKPFRCDECDISFARKTHLRQHMLTHS